MPDSNKERYGSLIEIVQANGRLWIAESADLALILTNESGEELILVWPTEEATRKVLSARPDLAQFQPASRTLERWLNSSTPNLAEDGILVAAHPDEQLGCLRVPAKSFARDLSAVPKLQGKDLVRLRRKQRRSSGD